MKGILAELLGRIGRRYWLDRISRALGRAYEQGLVDSWLLHHLDARIKGHGGMAANKRYPEREISDFEFIRRVRLTLEDQNAEDIDVFVDRRGADGMLIGAACKVGDEAFEITFVRDFSRDLVTKMQIIHASERLAINALSSLLQKQGAAASEAST